MLSEPEHGGSGGSSEARLPPGFPKGLRVLVVDDDSLCLKVVEQMLRKCDYKATTCINGSTALHLLRERPGDFDLVLSDVYMPDMDGFKLLEMVGLEMDLPVIMMSSNGETSTVLRGVTHGAVDFLIKPVRIEELRNVWQHVIRRKRELVKDLDSDEHSLDLKEEATEGGRKRKEAGFSPGDLDRGAGDDESNASKKPRVTWSVEMHQKFVGAVNQLGVDKAVPKKILDIMNVDGLTRENVASHLQKYRLYLKRVQGVPPMPPVLPPTGAPRTSKPGAPVIHPQPMTVLQPPINGSAFGTAAAQLGGAGLANGHAGLVGLGPSSAGAPSSPTVGSPARQPSPAPLVGIKIEQGQTGPRDVGGPVGIAQGAGSGNGAAGTGAPDSFQQGGQQFGGPGMLGGQMGLGPNPGLSPLLGLPMNPMGLNTMGLGGPMGMPPLSNPLGMMNGMPGSQPGMPGSMPGLGPMGPMGMPGMPGMNLNPLNFMPPGMGMPPLGMANGMMGPPMRLMSPGMNMGMGMGMGQQGMGMGQQGMGMGQQGMGMGQQGMNMGQQGMGMGNMGQQGMGMGQQGMGQPGLQGPPMGRMGSMGNMGMGMGSMGNMASSPYPPSTSPMLGPPLSMSRGHSLANGLQIPGDLAQAGQGGMGGGDGQGGHGSGPGSGVLGMPGTADGTERLEMGDLAGQLGELLQGDVGGPGDMAGLLNMDVGDMEGGFADLEGPGDMEGTSSMGRDNKEQEGGFDELFNFILKS